LTLQTFTKMFILTCRGFFDFKNLKKTQKINFQLNYNILKNLKKYCIFILNDVQFNKIVIYRYLIPLIGT
jgi:hypothetical protein